MAIRKIKLPGEQEPRDIGANSSNIIYDGDQGVTTTLNNKIQSIFTAIGDINSFEIALVNALPTENIDDHTIYFVPNSQDANTRDEYMYVNNQWELIGSTTIDLTDYLQKSDISDWAKAATKPTYTAREVGAVPTITSNSRSDSSITTTASSITIITDYDESENINTINIGPTDTKITSSGRNGTNTGLVINSTSTQIHNLVSPTTNLDAANKQYVDSQISSVTSTIPTITATQALTTGITIGSIDVSGTTTTFYAPEAVTPPAYSLSMTGATITLLADNVAASTITLPIYDGTIQ